MGFQVVVLMKKWRTDIGEDKVISALQHKS